MLKPEGGRLDGDACLAPRASLVAAAAPHSNVCRIDQLQHARVGSMHVILEGDHRDDPSHGYARRAVVLESECDRVRICKVVVAGASDAHQVAAVVRWHDARA
eukprot:247133-Prymnesium_polylepis.1